MEVVLLIFFAVVLGTLLNMAMKKPQQPPPPPPDTVTVINNAIEQRTETLKAEMLYKWETEGDTHRLIFRPTQAALKWNYGFTCRRVESSSNQISKGGQIPNIIIESAWAQIIGVQVPQPIAPAEGVVKLSERWGYTPVALVNGEAIGVISSDYKIHDETLFLPSQLNREQNKVFEDTITTEMLYSWEEREDLFVLRFCPTDTLRDYQFSVTINGGDYDDVRYYEYNDLINVSVILQNGYNSFVMPSPQMPAIEGIIKFSTDAINGVLKPDMFYILMIFTNKKATMLMYQQKSREEERKKIEQKFKEITERAAMRQKLLARQRKRDLEKQVRQELIDNGELFGEQHKRPHIPKEVADAVYRRDGGKCVYCGATENLHLDHIIPFSRGGATNIENLQLLCQKCNLQKSNKIG